jgi:hypothetical protein
VHLERRARRADRLLLVEAAARLLWVEVRLASLPFRWLARGLGLSGAEGALSIPPERERAARRVRWALEVARRKLPWQPRCLVIAMAGREMLARRRVGSTLYLGCTLSAGLACHAWLRSGSIDVAGGRGATGHAVLERFETRFD